MAERLSDSLGKNVRNTIESVRALVRDRNGISFRHNLAIEAFLFAKDDGLAGVPYYIRSVDWFRSRLGDRIIGNSIQQGLRWYDSKSREVS